MSGRDTHTKYPFAPLEEGAFFFPTDEGCYYTVEIGEAGYKLWASDRLSEDDKVFELSFDRKCDEGEAPAFDEAISNTIIHIFGTNMASKGDTCVYYHICDEERGAERARLYDWWFDDLKQFIPDFEMIDFEVLDIETNQIFYLSIFIHKSHPDRNLIEGEFIRAMQEQGLG